MAGLARLLEAPVILVVDAERMTRSVAAMVKGYQHFEAGTNVAAVILNRVSGRRHQEKLTDAVERYCGIPVVGAVPRDPELTITERHLGLVPSVEDGRSPSVVETICARVADHLDLDGIMRIAREAPARSVPETASLGAVKPTCRIGVVIDWVFQLPLS